MDLLIGMSEPLPFDGGFHVESEGRFTGMTELLCHTTRLSHKSAGDKTAIINAFPAGYPRAKLALASRLMLASMVSDGAFRTRGAAAAIARYCTFLRYAASSLLLVCCSWLDYKRRSRALPVSSMSSVHQTRNQLRVCVHHR